MDANKAQIKIVTHSTEYSGDEEAMFDNWTAFSKEWANNPNTEQPWTWDEINALQAGVQLYSFNWEIRCTQLYVEVTYTTGIARPLVGGSLAGNSLVGKGLVR